MWIPVDRQHHQRPSKLDSWRSLRFRWWIWNFPRLWLCGKMSEHWLEDDSLIQSKTKEWNSFKDSKIVVLLTCSINLCYYVAQCVSFGADNDVVSRDWAMTSRDLQMLGQDVCETQKGKIISDPRPSNGKNTGSWKILSMSVYFFQTGLPSIHTCSGSLLARKKSRAHFQSL